MRRRAFLFGSGALLAAPLAAEAQQAGKMYRIGFLSGTTVLDLLEALRQGLREAGWVEGQNFLLEHRSAESRFELIPELAAELTRRPVDVIVVAGTALPYIKQRTGNVPVVFVTADDPVSAGYVANLARPAGRMTGLTSLNVDLDAKRLEIVKAVLPGATRVGAQAVGQFLQLHLPQSHPGAVAPASVGRDQQSAGAGIGSAPHRLPPAPNARDGRVHAHGLGALDELFREEAVALAGPKGRHQPQRTHHHWGTAATELT